VSKSEIFDLLPELEKMYKIKKFYLSPQIAFVLVENPSRSPEAFTG
jgi:hypothetical protein